MPLDDASTLPPGTGDALQDAVAAFARQEIARRAPRPEIPLAAADFTAIAHAATATGLLDPGGDSVGLWHELATGEPPAFTLGALATLADANASAAWHLHGIALAGVALRIAGGDSTTLPAETALCCDGTTGIGRSALGRWLGGHALHEADRALLADTYGLRARHTLLAPGISHVAAIAWHDNAMWLEIQPLASTVIDSDDFPHGLDGCRSVRWLPAQEAALSAALDARLGGMLIAAQQLAQVAIARGTVAGAARLARDYASLRRQGARTIVMHDSVAMLLADIDTALATVDALLRDAACRRPEIASAVAIRREAMLLLARAANAAVQVHGGIGYMRDTGLEHRLRAVNALRLVGGSPAELALVDAGLRGANAALPEPLVTARDHLPGHLPADHPLSPFRALRRVPMLRMLSAYEPRDPWDVDTDRLPASLARLRRRTREFALRELAPRAASVDRDQRAGHACTPPLRELLRCAARDGLLTDLLPSPLGSVALRQYTHSLAFQQAIRVEELARVDGGLMLLLSAHNLGLCPLLMSGDLGILRRVVLPAFRATAAGDPQVFAFAITEPAAGSDAEDGHGALHQKAGVIARRANGGWRLSGRKVFISGGDIARYVTVFAALEGEGYESWTCFLVDALSPGFRVARNELKMGMRASGAAELELDDCFVPDTNVVGGVRNGWALARATLNLSRLPVAAMAVGFAQQAVDIATAFACRETLAGRPLVHYQQVQSTLADLQAETGAIRALVWHHARGWTPRQDGASICKFHATDRAQVVIESAMDLMGNSALRHDQGIERTFRDNRLTRIFEGTNQINRLAVIEDQQASLLARIAAHR